MTETDFMPFFIFVNLLLNFKTKITGKQHKQLDNTKKAPKRAKPFLYVFVVIATSK